MKNNSENSFYRCSITSTTFVSNVKTEWHTEKELTAKNVAYLNKKTKNKLEMPPPQIEIK